MLHDTAPITAKDVGIAGLVCAVGASAALLVLLVYKIVKKCREPDQEALLDNAI